MPVISPVHAQSGSGLTQVTHPTPGAHAPITHGFATWQSAIDADSSPHASSHTAISPSQSIVASSGAHGSGHSRGSADLRVDVLDRSGRGGEVTAVARFVVENPAIARVDASGSLRALRDGVTTVQAIVGDTRSTPLEVQRVTARVTALSIEGMPPRMPLDASVRLRATGFDTGLSVVDVSGEVTWTSSNPEVLTVSPTGVVTAVGRGTAQITCSIGSLFTRSNMIAVTNVPPGKLEVLPPGMTLTLTDRQQFRARATFEDGSRGAVTQVVERVVDGTAADIRQDGMVIPREPDTTTVRARYLGVESAPVTVTVTR